MNKINLLAAAFLFCSFSISAQLDTTIRNFPDRYSLDLPQEWKNNPKLTEAITEILPKAFPEYIDSNKQFCTECKAGLSVKLLIDKPLFKPAEKTYQFRAALGLFDSTGKGLIDLLLVSPSEVHQMKLIANYEKEPLPLNNNEIITNNITDRYGNIVRTVNIPLSPPPMINNIPQYGSLYPSLTDLMAIAGQRVYEIRKIVSKIK